MPAGPAGPRDAGQSTSRFARDGSSRITIAGAPIRSGNALRTRPAQLHRARIDRGDRSRRRCCRPARLRDASGRPTTSSSPCQRRRRLPDQLRRDRDARLGRRASIPGSGSGRRVIVVPAAERRDAAKELATLDALSSGRLIVGVGVGWNETGVRGTSARPTGSTSAARTSTRRSRCGGISGRAPPSRSTGRFHSFDDFVFGPLPAQRSSLPIWIGAANRTGPRPGRSPRRRLPLVRGVPGVIRQAPPDDPRRRPRRRAARCRRSRPASASPSTSPRIPRSPAVCDPQVRRGDARRDPEVGRPRRRAAGPLVRRRHVDAQVARRRAVPPRGRRVASVSAGAPRRDRSRRATFRVDRADVGGRRGRATAPDAVRSPAPGWRPDPAEPDPAADADQPGSSERADEQRQPERPTPTRWRP